MQIIATTSLQLRHKQEITILVHKVGKIDTLPIYGRAPYHLYLEPFDM